MSAPRTGYVSDRGRRPSNQDAVVATVLADGREVVAVADGMGGHAGGEVASAAALSALLDALDRGAELAAAYAAADAAIRAAAGRDPSLEGMGTTLVTLLRSGSRYWVGNVGDSRAYRVAADGIAQITRDHSFAEEAVRSGQMSAEEIARSPWKNALTRALGAGDAPELDVFGPFDADDPHAVLLCSDGLHGVVEEEQIRALIAAAPDPASAAEGLAALALRAGSRDNVTAALRDFGLLAAEAPAAEPVTAPLPPPPAVHPPRARREERGLRVLQRHPGRRRRRLPLPGEGLIFAACCGALVVWLAYFLASF